MGELLFDSKVWSLMGVCKGGESKEKEEEEEEKDMVRGGGRLSKR